MNILIEGAPERYQAYLPEFVPLDRLSLTFCPLGSTNEERLALCPDAEVFLVDAISTVDGDLIRRMPKLKMIHSEGVAFNGIDIQAARERGVFVCNNQGCNAGAVAEQAIFLMLSLLRRGIPGDRAVREGRQIQMKEQAMVEGITELGDCKIGLIGFGHIAKATAQRLAPFGCELFYDSAHRKDPETEKAFSVTYLPLGELLAACDIISLHAAVTPQTCGMVNAAFLSQMKNGSYLINTARGELVDHLAVKEALFSGKLAGAGFDTLSPEPVPADHPLVRLPPEVEDRVVFSPHLGGITASSFCRAHRHMWSNVVRVLNGFQPDSVVNAL